MCIIIIIIIIMIVVPGLASCRRRPAGQDRPGSERGMIRLETFIELKLLNSTFSSLSSYCKCTNNYLVRKGTNVVSTHGIAANFMFFDRLPALRTAL